MRLQKWASIVAAAIVVALPTGCRESVVAPTDAARVTFVIANAGALPTTIASVVVRITEGTASPREVALSISSNRTSASGTVSVAPGAVTFQFLARNSSSTTIFASPPFSATLTAGESATFTSMMACVHTSCDGTGGSSATLAPTVLVPAAESESNNTSATADVIPTITVGSKTYALISGYISTDGDLDWFTVNIPSGKTVYVNTVADRTGFSGWVDTELFAYSPSATSVGSNDQCSGSTNDSCVQFTSSSSGSYSFAIRGYQGGTGRYTLIIEF